MGNLSDLAGLSAVQQVDFTDAGLAGTVPAAWSTGAWSGSLLSLVLAQNPLINGSVPDISGYDPCMKTALPCSSKIAVEQCYHAFKLKWRRCSLQGNLFQH